MLFLLVVPILCAQLPPDQNLIADNKTPLPAAPAPPKPALTTEVRADIAMARKEHRLAIDMYKSILPATHVTLNKIGIAYHHLTELDNARRYYERSVKLKPDYSEAINNLGTVYYASRSHRRAISYYNKALRYAPNSASIYSNLGTAWFARKKYDRASEAYQKALELDPNVFEHRGTNGVLLQERSVEERAKFYFFLAKTYAKVGQLERVYQYMRKALEDGFKERKRFVEDPEFAALQELPEFKELLQLQPRVL